jgi:putative two-component system response regulator
MAFEQIMVVDDTPENLKVLSMMLQRNGYCVSAFPQGKMALSAADAIPPNLVLLDIDMPEMNGYQVCEAFKSKPELKDIPIIFISALDDPNDKIRALKCGGVDYITKPFQIDEVYARVDTHLQLYKAREILKDFNEKLKNTVADQLEEINKSQLAMIFALAKLSHTRDDDTGLHLERVQYLCRMLSEEIAGVKGFLDQITPNFITAIFHASPLHDLGKVGIKDAILLKPGKLTPEEFETMKAHTTIGARTLESVHKQYPNNEFIRMGIDIAKYHHEKWDGSGYPEGLYGTAIPLSARIMALVDVYEALRARRPYKEPFPHEKSAAIILEGRGKHFDPHIVDGFVRIQENIESFYATLADD